MNADALYLDAPIRVHHDHVTIGGDRVPGVIAEGGVRLSPVDAEHPDEPRRMFIEFMFTDGVLFDQGIATETTSGGTTRVWSSQEQLEMDRRKRG